MNQEPPPPRRVCACCGDPLADGATGCAVCEGPTERWSREAGELGEATDPPRDRGRPPSPLSSSSPSGSRFPPGTMLAGRYRIVSLLGSGGMGEVYRAEDLKLGQTVALKFLPRGAARSAEVRERLYREVRLGRQISHPNVCRLYDVVEWEGHPFVTMEYIDGEDLASLIRRIGALPPAKTLELAREISAGLAAAHALGVVHRDLKPANVMIDGRGRARITDFGLAVVAEEADAGREIAGTPVYMAPEQLRGQASTPRSDLYALGLVLYEMVTGERRFAAGSIPELLSRHEESRPEALLGALAEVDPALRRVIGRCLREAPEARPTSIQGVIAALPGGDPLQIAVDAGETPSPELVAAAEGSGALRPATTLLLFAGFVALLAGNALFTERWGQVPGFVEVPEPPEALTIRAGNLLETVGVATRGRDSARGWSFDWDRRRWIADHGFDWWGRGREMAPSPASIWVRFAPEPLDPRGPLERVTPDDPPLDRPGMARVRMDAQGRLLALTVVPPRRSAAGGGNEPDWQGLLEATGLDLAGLEAVEPEWTPPVGATGRRAWTGAYPGQAEVPMRVEAAWSDGRPVWLWVMPPWVAAGHEAVPDGATSRRLWEAADLFRALVFPTFLVVAALLARRNLRRSRGDRQGALRLALFAGVTVFVYLMLQVDFVPDAILAQGIGQLGMSIAHGFVSWLVYLAMEPYLRRAWPRIMVGWHRLLAGRLRDARVGREVLIGLTAGLFVAGFAGELAVRMRLPDIPHSPPLHALARYRHVVAQLFESLELATTTALFGGLALLLATLVLRRRSWAIAGFWAASVVAASYEIFDLRYALLYMALVATVNTLVIVRVGLVGLAAMALAGALVDVPLTLDPSAWYLPHALVPLLSLLGLGIWAAWRSLGEEPSFAGFLGD